MARISFFVHEHMLNHDGCLTCHFNSFTTGGLLLVRPRHSNWPLPASQLCRPDAGRGDSGPTISGQIHLHTPGLAIPSFGVSSPPAHNVEVLHASLILMENVPAHVRTHKVRLEQEAHGRTQSQCWRRLEVPMYPCTWVPQSLRCNVGASLFSSVLRCY